ncbi:MAG: hypothetical protein ACQES9_09700 [Myxococcota bacterium]
MAGEVFGSDVRSNFADIATNISKSYDKADEVKFRRQTMTSYFGTEAYLGQKLITVAIFNSGLQTMLINANPVHYNQLFF